MRFMILLKANEQSEAGELPDATLLTGMGNYNQALIDAGVLVDGAGLQGTDKGARVRFSGATRAVVEGPFPDPSSLVAGYWVFQVKSKEEAIEWVKRCPNPHRGEAEIEIRQMFEVEDFPDAPAEVREMELARRDRR